jgi:nucleoside-diphosphate-sugar epimerase
MSNTTTKSDSQSSGKAETILVTGATSMVGSEVVKLILQARYFIYYVIYALQVMLHEKKDNTIIRTILISTDSDHKNTKIMKP